MDRIQIGNLSNPLRDMDWRMNSISWYIYIYIGSCLLHIIHEAFKAGVGSTNWELKKVLKGTFTLLRDSPARRDDYVSLTRSNTFPLLFCVTRWLEDRKVADRLINVWDKSDKNCKILGEASFMFNLQWMINFLLVGFNSLVFSSAF